MAIGALAIADVPRYASAAATALALSAEGYPHALERYADGGWPEGPGYWTYATKYVLATSEALLTATGDSRHLAAPGVNVTALFGIHTHLAPSRPDRGHEPDSELVPTLGPAVPDSHWPPNPHSLSPFECSILCSSPFIIECSILCSSPFIIHH